MKRILNQLSVLVLSGVVSSALADDTKPATQPGQDAAAIAPTTPETPAAEAPVVAKPAVPEKKTPVSAADEVNRVFPVDKDEWLKDPFLVLDLEMDAVVEDFKDGKAKPPADTTQPRIVSRFDAVIALLEKKCSGSGGGGGGRPVERSGLAKGPGGMGELKTPKKTGKGYDDLTPKEREKILQSKTEGFPPGFEDVLADYYRRLAKADGAAPEPSVESPPAKPDLK